MAQVEIIRLGHALVDGERGEKGGKPSKDSVWGLAYIGAGKGQRLVKFYGRRGGKLRFKTEKRTELDAALELFALKLEGKDVKGIQYVDITSAKAIKQTCPTIMEDVAKGFAAAQKEGKVNTRSTKPAKAAAAE
jgi:hypothetical protein